MIPSDLLLSAYARGLFPMALPEGELGWFSPDPRGVLPLDEFHVPHGLKRALRRAPYEIRFNSAFSEVIAACARRKETWIDEEITESYTALHRLGCAHSVEAWAGGCLVGGLYGVSLGGAFFGESMFHTATDASKVALVALVARLRERGFMLLDTQWTTAHLRQFGAKEIPRLIYLQLLARALKLPRTFAEAPKNS